MSRAEYDDLRRAGRFRPGRGTMEGKWFADTWDGVLRHAAAHYPDGGHAIVAADVPDELLPRLYRPGNLDGFGPATYIDPGELDGLTPILEVGHD